MDDKDRLWEALLDAGASYYAERAELDANMARGGPEAGYYYSRDWDRLKVLASAYRVAFDAYVDASRAAGR